MSFRRRMVLLAAGAVAAAIVIASVVVYVVTGNELRGQIDASLRQKLTPGPQCRSDPLHHPLLGRCCEVEEKEGKWPPGGLPRIAFGGPAARTTHVRRARVGARPVGEASRPRKRLAGIVARGNRLDRRQCPARARAAPAAKAQSMGVHRSGAVRFAKLVLPAPKLGGATGYVQLFQSNGQVLRSEGKGSLLPVTAATRAVAAGRRERVLQRRDRRRHAMCGS